MNITTLLITYFAFINLLSFFTMYSDKERAKKRVFRIPESTLFTLAIIGGSLGSLAGMYLFRHKTRHLSFVLGIPAILFFQILLVVILSLLPVGIKFI